MCTYFDHILRVPLWEMNMHTFKHIFTFSLRYVSQNFSFSSPPHIFPLPSILPPRSRTRLPPTPTPTFPPPFPSPLPSPLPLPPPPPSPDLLSFKSFLNQNFGMAWTRGLPILLPERKTREYYAAKNWRPGPAGRKAKIPPIFLSQERAHLFWN